MSSLPPTRELDIGEVAALTRRLSIMEAVATALNESAGLPVLLDRGLDAVLEVAGVDGGGVFLFDHRSDQLRLAVHRGVSDTLAASYSTDPGSTLRTLARDPNHPAIVERVTAGRFRPLLRDEGVQSFAAIPLHARGHVLGILLTISRAATPFDQRDVDLLNTIGRQIGGAIEREQLYEQERRRAVQLEAITEAGRRLGAILTEPELLHEIVRAARIDLGYDAGSLLLLDDDGATLTVVAGSGLGNETLTGRRLAVDDGGDSAGWVVTHRQPLLINDMRQRRAADDRRPERSEVAAPLIAGDRILGVLRVECARIHAFDETDIAVVQTFAGQVAVALENAWLYEDTRRSLKRAHAIQEVTTAISASLDLPTTLEQALDAAMDVFGAGRAAIFLIERESGRVFRAAVRGLSDEYLAAVEQHYRHAPLPAAMLTMRSIFVADAQAGTLAPGLTDAARREGFRSVLFLPLRQEEPLAGMFVLYHDQPRTYSESDITLAQTFADQAAIAIEHARLYEAERRAREHAATILDATRTLTSSLHLGDVLREAATCIATALRERYCGVWLLDEERETLTPVCGIAVPADDALAGPFNALPAVRLADSPRMQALVEGQQPVIFSDFSHLSSAEDALRQRIGCHSYIDIPLVTREQVVGIAAVPVLTVDRLIDQEDLEVAMAIARSAALAVENARLYGQAQRLAISEERNRLARELHDSVTHSLFSMTLIGQALPRLLERDPGQARERIDRMNELGRGALAEMRALIFELRPAALAEEGLAVALERYSAAFQSRESVTVELTLTERRRLPASLEDTIFRVTQEALNNIAKHAGATHVKVRLSFQERAVELTVTDNGRGFDPSQPVERRSLGLNGMRERATLVNGSLLIESAPGHGATVRLKAPLG